LKTIGAALGIFNSAPRLVHALVGQPLPKGLPPHDLEGVSNDVVSINELQRHLESIGIHPCEGAMLENRGAVISKTIED
jgi:hypothetical protein